MRLKTLEIKGFKSFANDTAIHFNEDVIGIVGPNGSGKSNVVDSIRWVLGEQKSSQLRLDKMSSVIFNGTKKRKEAQMASVALTFENTKNVLPTDYHTVTIARILYRSGESEYRLNGVPCRLKDITTLLMDTGMGPDSYAIIALGMVDDLLSDREQARRKMFEQAAGVSKYKARKHETKQKLEATSGDLDRIEDLLFEIDDQLKKLEKQAQRTQKFYELKADYKRLSIEFAVLNLARHKNVYKNLESEIAKEEDKYSTLEIDSRKLEAEIESLRKQHTDKELNLSGQQSELNQLVGSIRSKENEKQMLSQKSGFLQQDESRLLRQIEQAKQQVNSLDDDVRYYQTTINGEKNIEADLEKALDNAKKQLDSVRSDHSLLKGNLEEFTKVQQAMEREISELEKNKAVNQAQIENLQREMARTNADIEQRRAEMENLNTQLAERIEAEERFQNRIEILEQEEEKRLADLQKTEQEAETLTKKTAEKHRELDAKRNEYKLTKSMVESLEGFPESIRFLSTQKDFAKKCPLLSDLIYVQEEYRVAIENFLEPYLNYYVATDTQDAINAIQLLGKSQKGRANFFLLEAFQNYAPPLMMLPDARQALDLVQVDAQYRPLVAYLLENVLISENLNPVLPDEKTLGNAILLSKSGNFTARKYILSGGSVGLFEGKKIGRKKNLEILEIEIKKLESVENELNTKLATLRTQVQSLKNSDKKQALERERNLMSQTSRERASIQAKVENMASFVAAFNSKADESAILINNLLQNISQNEISLSEKYKAAEAAKNRFSNADGSYKEVAEKLSQNSQKFNEVNIEFIKQQNKINTFQQELSFREKQLAEFRASISQNESQSKKNALELEEIRLTVAELDEKLRVQYKQKKEKEAALGEVEQNWAAARNQIHQAEDKHRQSFRQLQDLQIAINQRKDKFTDVKFEITAINERLRVEFGMSVNDVINREPDPTLKRDEVEKEVNNMKRRLDTYGEINPLAVEAYNEIKERHTTIATQRNDILAAKVSLMETIKEIEETATARFLESFEQVRAHFVDVFRSLFNEEDTADLVLAQPDNPLDSDINIIAKPKGKRPQHISQLSGGEKTLTAIALLFALYLLKPAPFCIFDEVDAPLDDANIEKFNRIIKKFSKDSQFIIVTHNKATMAAVDVIYGVYMPEQGVSSVTPVDFRSLGHDMQVI